MSLLPRFGNHAREVELERRVNALQSALSQSDRERRVGPSRALHYGVTVLSLAIGFTLGVYRHAIKEAFIETASAVGLASSSRDAAAEAEAAFQKGDYTKALKLARPLADAGDPRGEAIIGLAYYRGRGAPHDDAEGAKWLLRAADKGDAVARFTLGVMYGEGRGVPQDFAEAARWYQRAAEQGDAQAQYNLGLAYAHGEGVAQTWSRRICGSTSLPRAFPPPTRATAPPRSRTATRSPAK
jgi:hypothetical protein